MRFSRLYPNFNRFLGHHLLTVDQPHSITKQAAIDRAALAAVSQWQADPRFISLMPRLLEIEQRLRAHLESALRGGVLDP
jgi:hypothetical protein